MEDIGELIVGAWLKEFADCEFVEYGVRTDGQGEIDVVGLDLENGRAYICEAATHVNGFWYANTTEKQADKIFEKFVRAHKWAKCHLKRISDHQYMLWTPVVKNSRPGANLDQAKSIAQAESRLLTECDVRLEVICNEEYRSRIKYLREVARKDTSKIRSPILRMMQIEEWNRRNVAAGTRR